MSSPWVRMVLVPQTTMPTLWGYSPSCSAAVFLDQPIGGLGADLPGGLGRDRVDVDAVEVPPGRQDAGHPPRRCAARPGGDEAAGEAAERVGELVGGPVEAGDDLRRG